MQFQTPPTLIRLLIVLGLASAGSVAMAAHPAIFLLDKNYDEINPITGENADQPFSTAATCGSCHDYEEITAGYHFQMGWDVVADDFGEGTSKPWDISNGMMGSGAPCIFGRSPPRRTAPPTTST